MPKISAIVPIYNVEKHLVQCLDSIINQTFTDFECICVNDGSTDNSLSILQKYANKDSRIKIINQKNKGLSGARNAALKTITGKYVAFIDSDDFVLSEYLEKLINVAEKENSDIVYCRHKIYFSLDNRYENGANEEKLNKLFYEYSRINKRDNHFRYILDIVENSRSACMKLYKTELLRKNNLCFFEDVYAEEDFSFNILANLYSNKISLLNEELYYYRKQVDSLTANKEKLRINALKSFIILTKTLYNRNLLKDSSVLQDFIIEGFIYRVGKNISKEKYILLLSTIQSHLFFLQEKCKKSSSICKIKIKFSMLLIKILKSKSSLFFRIVKNFVF